MPRRRLPPLNSLRAFEAAARQLNFERAGDEIAVTASAVGQQVKALETWLGRPLFVRLPSKGVALTSVGERYAAALTELLDRLDEATARALRAETSRALTVSTLASFAANWLIPRLGSLRERHPDLEVRVSVSSSRTDFAREDVDVAIRSGLGSYPGLRSDLLLEETFFPVCSAALLDDPTRPLREPSNLRHHTLVQAAAAGQGVALATNVLIGDYLEAGRLVRPFPHEVRGRYQYYVVCPEATADRPAIAAFRAWLAEAAT